MNQMDTSPASCSSNLQQRHHRQPRSGKAQGLPLGVDAARRRSPRHFASRGRRFPPTPRRDPGRMAAEEIAELVAVTAKLTAIMAEFEAAVLARGATLKELVERRPHRRSPDPGPRRRRRCFAQRKRFASSTICAPTPPHRVRRSATASKVEDGSMNHVLHPAAIVRPRGDTHGRATYRHEIAGSAQRWWPCTASNVTGPRQLPPPRRGRRSALGHGGWPVLVTD